MLDIAVESGTSDIVATPHANPMFSYSRERAEILRQELQAAAPRSIRIHLGCDFHLDYDLVNDALQHPSRYSINGLNYLLIELPESIAPKTVADVIDRLCGVGLRPILTHPERYSALRGKRDEIARWMDSGMLVQVTGASLLGRFGSKARKMAESMMDDGQVHFLASDAHDPVSRTPDLRGAWECVSERWGEPTAIKLLETNPRATLTGADVQPVEKSARRRRWFSFWS